MFHYFLRKAQNRQKLLLKSISLSPTKVRHKRRIHISQKKAVKKLIFSASWTLLCSLKPSYFSFLLWNMLYHFLPYSYCLPLVETCDLLPHSAVYFQTKRQSGWEGLQLEEKRVPLALHSPSRAVCTWAVSLCLRVMSFRNDRRILKCKEIFVFLWKWADRSLVVIVRLYREVNKNQVNIQKWNIVSNK